jgi:hypothetical protein
MTNDEARITIRITNDEGQPKLPEHALSPAIDDFDHELVRTLQKHRINGFAR